jgi:hypothetical protein
VHYTVKGTISNWIVRDFGLQHVSRWLRSTVLYCCTLHRLVLQYVTLDFLTFHFLTLHVVSYVNLPCVTGN